VLVITAADRDALLAAAYRAYPLECCALLAGPPAVDGRQEVAKVYVCRNAAASSRHYIVDPLDHMRADRDAEDNGWEIVGVAHSHTHSEPFPSPTDVTSAPDPAWHYVIVGLKRDAAETRSYLIVDGAVVEEQLVLDPG